LASGFDRKHIGIISSDVLNEASSAIVGASAGMAIGGVAGMLLAAVALAIPGIGPVLVAGPAVTLLAGTTIGALAGGLIGGLRKKGVPEDEAHFYAEGVRRGGTLITVNAETDELAQRAVEVMKRHGAVDLDQRCAEWKQQGWSGRVDSAGDAARTAETAGKGAARRAAEQPSSRGREVTSRPVVDESVDAERVAPSTAGAGGLAEPAVALSAVRVYSFAIEMPEEETLAAGAGAPIGGRAAAANQPTYGGPERRMSAAPYTGMDRRHAA
jgi:hypothetical protein